MNIIINRHVNLIRPQQLTEVWWNVIACRLEMSTSVQPQFATYLQLAEGQFYKMSWHETQRSSEIRSGNSKTCYLRSIGRSLNIPQNINCKHLIIIIIIIVIVIIIIIIIIQGKFLPVQVTTAYKECIILLTLNVGTRRRWVVYVTPRLLNLREIIVILLIPIIIIIIIIIIICEHQQLYFTAAQSSEAH